MKMDDNMKHALADALEDKMAQMFERRRAGDRRADRQYEQLVESATVLRRSALKKRWNKRREDHD
jgi:hypothetical protein